MLLMLLIDEEGQAIVEAIYTKHHKRMLYVASGILDSRRAEEAVHDVFVKLIEKFINDLEQLRDKPAQFFVITVRNHSINIAKKNDFSISINDDDYESSDLFRDDSGNPEKVVLEKDDESRLVELIQKLKPLPRMMLEYRFIQGYTNKEISQILGVSESVVSSRIERAKKALADKLAEEGNYNDG